MLKSHKRVGWCTPIHVKHNISITLRIAFKDWVHTLKLHPVIFAQGIFLTWSIHPSLLSDIIRSDVALDKQKGCRLASHPDIMLELQREKAASTQLVLLKEQLSNMYSNITFTGRRLHTPTPRTHTHHSLETRRPHVCVHRHSCAWTRVNMCQWKRSAFRMTDTASIGGMRGWIELCSSWGQ